ncbi:hypothetical protein CPLU01_14529 [Colletotrichum plurivorum]|uniref:Uncharacterized protein n=1 Tax=Colletotrichum plurivorum TaxID=2175906 RepID=A0A8H6MYM7_9PEZI|nr:hypothetical protein CPLU01_14529 [Colletotrichum plurivorum]
MTQSFPPPSGSTGASLPALARFEFEAGKGNEGTKILMVEWSTSASSADLPSPTRSKIWQVSWEGKTNHLLVDDKEAGANKRVYFLLPPGAPIPPVITISYPGGAALAVKPLPAIFPPSLGAASSDAGSRGVLHTIWAKKRLSELQDEIDTEVKTNSESVGVEMALQERQWIAEHFGINPRPGLGANINTPAAQALPTPVSLSSPVGGKLGEKLKGLKLATSATDLVPGSTSKTSTEPLLSSDSPLQSVSFSPVAGDVAVSSFSSFAGQVRARPNLGGSASLDAVLNANNIPTRPSDHGREEELFALPMSPRSPEMKRSPFSLS